MNVDAIYWSISVFIGAFLMYLGTVVLDTPASMMLTIITCASIIAGLVTLRASNLGV